ncbi:MaoC-like acyl dehydratase [Pseudomonas amygdali pv. hibisci]|uniref:MaoC-like acyl dehydratase n=2 Tax=Pseudomonas amygdali TaxID=47877 RepID=A0AB34U9A0_PSEA0|nr:MaoC-like domain-containing protein [Pseudomonas amygdali pv. lachrymans]KPX56006.1 MaoC-like acyl dehydratase [Pseudomonas amygdali pv. hibisci]RMM32806.1 MaoC-like acyl dehydratase [Pseudomonas amygdali pv. lachrymans]RMN61644.1 MaoC-like acyl dehydratase [Pseudomonas amygdali pv. hibisci]RMP36444.1 MaoC-like domain-containing protein [Pseudomonas amygdali pv. lachrymans]
MTNRQHSADLVIRPQTLADAGGGTSTQTTSDKESSMPSVPVTELKHYIGKDAECSDWLTIDQERINLFAEATGDFQFIHVDPVKAAQTPFGATIAHGFLSLSLIPKLMEGIMVLPEGLKMAVNYGMDSVRFVQPVLVNSRVRLKVQLTEVTEKKPGQWLLKAIATLEIEGQEKPAFVAEPLTLCFV